ncbi:unnamed protein product [Diatraea saccharalis]|uniref:Uncharacterized protein n=1 Tax=Diatraea saccharalis TaxID=40085 RepID=A0A9N9R959_9NEOP|nr:unnamed protein product [Diatraea saccharalis]
MITTGRAEFKSMGNDYEYLPLVKSGVVLVKEQTAIDDMMYADYLTKAREGVEEADSLIFIVQAGIIDFLERRDLPSTKICPLNLQSKDRQLRNSDLIMTYMIMIVGISSAVALFIGEVITKRYVRVNVTKNSKHKHKKARFNNNPKIYYDDSRPPPYESIFGKNGKFKVTENSKPKIINGREYLVVNAANGDTRLIPVRTPSAFLYYMDK